MKYRKKPVVISAIQFDGTPGGALAVFDLFDIPGAKFVPDMSNLAHGSIAIPTLEGLTTASAGDWVIKGVEGEFYACKPSIFAATYEPAERPAEKPISTLDPNSLQLGGY